MGTSNETMSSDGGSLSDLVMGFFDDIEDDRWAAGDSDGQSTDGEDGEEAEPSGRSMAESQAFWETQQQLLMEALRGSSSVESKIRKDTGEAVRRMELEGFACSCSTSHHGKNHKMACRNCTLGFISQKLRELGYNSAICKSKWSRCVDMPSGEHRYVDVVMESKIGRRGTTRVVIELNLRGEFEMARASREYAELVGRLPELYVGRADRLKDAVRVMCAAAKRCMKENNMHMGPWRKHKYMRSKWLSTPERVVSANAAAAAAVFGSAAAGEAGQGRPRPRASMLTFDLQYCTAVLV